MDNRKKKGFTLIELMLVVAIIGLLSAIALPKFSNLILKSQEAAVKGHLGSFRSAVMIYYADNEGNFPGPGGGVIGLDPVIVPKYIDAIPYCKIPQNRGQSATNICAGNWTGNIAFYDPTKDTNTWFYSGVDSVSYPMGFYPGSGYRLQPGYVTVNCNCTSSTGQKWTEF